MIRRLPEENGNVLVVERVEREPAISPMSNHSGGTEQTKVVRNRRLGQSNHRGDIANAELMRGQCRNDAEACWIAKCGE